jgi:crotonobetainyl-CoA:carnitine CoA-transferase CaiB-like acyl-CoA transferase
MKPLLDGVRILDLSHMLAGPYCTLMLADLGAEVIKIETPGEGDRIRRMGIYKIGGQSAYFLSINRNKKSITLKEKHHVESQIGQREGDILRAGEEIRCSAGQSETFDAGEAWCGI